MQNDRFRRAAAGAIVALALGATGAGAGTAVAGTSLHTPAKLMAAEDALFAADVHHDAAAIERGFADEAVFVHANGMTQSKADYLAATRADTFQIRDITTENRVANVFGNVGVVRGIKRLVTKSGLHLGGSYLTVYILRDGRWQMLDEQSAPLPPAGKS